MPICQMHYRFTEDLWGSRHFSALEVWQHQTEIPMSLELALWRPLELTDHLEDTRENQSALYRRCLVNLHRHWRHGCVISIALVCQVPYKETHSNPHGFRIYQYGSLVP